MVAAKVNINFFNRILKAKVPVLLTITDLL